MALERRGVPIKIIVVVVVVFILPSRYVQTANKYQPNQNSYKGVGDGQVHMAMLKINNQQGPTAQHREPCPRPCSSLEGRGGAWDSVFNT